jgi:hypothetical protein
MPFAVVLGQQRADTSVCCHQNRGEPKAYYRNAAKLGKLAVILPTMATRDS